MQRPGKILIVAESIDVEDSSGTKGRVALIKNLHKAGYDLRVYHYTRQEIQLENVRCFAIKEDRRSILFFLSRAERQLRHKLNLDLHKPLENIFGFSFTLFNDRNSILKALRKINDFKPDLIITVSKGGSFRPHHALLKLPEWHPKWLAYMHDPYPMHHYPRPFTWTEPGHKKKETFIKEVSHKARYTAFPSFLLKNWMGKFYPAFLKSAVIIPHQIIDLDTSKVEFPDYFDPKVFNILHAGNLLGARNPKVLLQAYQRFLEKHPKAKENSRLLFLGGNNKRVRAMAENSSNVYSSEAYVKFEEVYNMQQHTAVNIIIEAKAEISPFLPGKFPHCINAEKPILLLGPKKSEVKRLLGEDYFFWSEIDDLPKIILLIETLYLKWVQSPEELKLCRPDLKTYMSVPYLKTVVDEIL